MFEATAVLLEKDPTLWCVSSWNDNGFKHLAKDARKLFRTSYFPGLGWMMRRELWLELAPKWPKEHWDHWMRMTSTSNGRECVVPEVNRNFNIGAVGTNVEKQMYDKYLSRMSVSGEAVVNFGDLAPLKLDRYDAWINQLIGDAVQWNWKGRTSADAASFAKSAALRGGKGPPPLLLLYETNRALLAIPCVVSACLFRSIVFTRSTHACACVVS